MKIKRAEVESHESKNALANMVEISGATLRIKDQRARFVEGALVAKRRFEETGAAYDAPEIFAYLRAKLTADTAKRPQLGAFAVDGSAVGHPNRG